ncbi:Zn-ribbon domain-containing protein [Candidatus Woesearchaeota archaeon]|nr:Zn-ribbon domain-containing protein [Candidatus Woesearchaeota archaeon]MBW3006112.1 Zn-ribbon domain-containing protein [Candidatus Woesearchaeota archaeon]
MPHQCVRCDALYDDGAQEILKGCPCGGKLFFYIKKERLEKVKAEEKIALSPVQKEQIEKDIYDMTGIDDRDRPVVLDLESIKVLKPGKFELDLVKLFKGDPLIFKLASGKYIIDVAETFRQMRKNK